MSRLPPALPLLSLAAGATARQLRARHSGSGSRGPRGGGRAGRGGAGPGGSARVLAAGATCVCGSQEADPSGWGVSRCRSWRCRRWWSTPWCCSVWWIISTGERAARGGLVWLAAPSLLSHGHSGEGAAAAGALMGGGRLYLAEGSRPSAILGSSSHPASYPGSSRHSGCWSARFFYPSLYAARLWGSAFSYLWSPRPRAYLSLFLPLFTLKDSVSPRKALQAGAFVHLKAVTEILVSAP